MSSVSQAAFHVTSKKMDNMAVSSSSGWTRARCSGVTSIVDVMAELCVGEAFGFPLVDMVYRLV